MGGLDQADEKDCFFPTTVVKNPSPDSRLMQEEIFGPVMPVRAVDR
jgi:acyl-CoA reductase-like NAD-dependent aldehyde dehydrogenase